jgi:uracil-DNA glycosylase
MAYLGEEKFRWTFGPMYYRGRLDPERVKVFVVGQEGAQDESISNRAFTGSTGTRMQKFLHGIGIRENYLFMNTFVYTIFGQYSEEDGVPEKMRWLAQDFASPIVVYRHSLFDQVLATNKNSLALIVGVGRAGQDSVATWVQHRWNLQGENGAAKCPFVGNQCDTSVLGNVKVLGLPHPGAAADHNSGDGAVAALRASFAKAVNLVKKWKSQDSGWLPNDPGGSVVSGEFRYGYAAVPHRDFDFGTTEVFGAWATTSNRTSKRDIQIFSRDGIYNAEGVPLSYKTPADKKSEFDRFGSTEGFQEGDVEWEHPRVNYGHYDRGPGVEDARLLLGLGNPEWPKFEELGVTSHWSFGRRQIYRGRLQEAQVLVVADQFSHDDLFSGRALTGLDGQRLQSFLRGLGLNRSYAIIRTLPVDTLDLSDAKRLEIANHPQVTEVRNQILNRVLSYGKTKVVITIGEGAEAAVNSWKPSGVNIVNLASPLEDSHVSQWQGELSQLKSANLVTPDQGVQALAQYSGQLTDIPRLDLPIHTKWWVGSAGDRAMRAFNKATDSLDPNYYTLFLPKWVYGLDPKPIANSERDALKNAP